MTKLTFVVASAFFISMNAQANLACKILFEMPHQYVSKIEVIEAMAGNATQRHSNSLSQLYIDLQMAYLSEAPSNKVVNGIYSDIIAENNNVLNAVTWLQSQKSSFVSRSERERFGKLMDQFKMLFTGQSFSPESIEKILATRLQIDEAIAAEDAKHVGRPIGFMAERAQDQQLQRQQHKAEMREPVRTIGFLRESVLDIPYGGRQKEIQLEAAVMAADKAAVVGENTSGKISMGFIKTSQAAVEATGKEEAKPMKSIGFLASDEAVDVGYQIGIGFDLKTGSFTPTNTRSIGFVLFE